MYASHVVRIASSGATVAKSGGYAMPLCGESTTIGSAGAVGCATNYAGDVPAVALLQLNVTMGIRFFT